MLSFKQFINEKSTYVGQCDKVRCDDKGEAFWQDMMKNKQKISKQEFLKNVNPKNILDAGETFDDWVSYNQAQDSGFGFYKSSGNIYFIQVAGFEYIWKTT